MARDERKPGEWQLRRPTSGLFATTAFAFRLRMPAGRVMQPHEHDGVEHITVLTGTLEMRFGNDQPRAGCHRGPSSRFPPGRRYGHGRVRHDVRR